MKFSFEQSLLNGLYLYTVQNVNKWSRGIMWCHWLTLFWTGNTSGISGFTEFFLSWSGKTPKGRSIPGQEEFDQRHFRIPGCWRDHSWTFFNSVEKINLGCEFISGGSGSLIWNVTDCKTYVTCEKMQKSYEKVLTFYHRSCQWHWRVNKGYGELMNRLLKIEISEVQKLKNMRWICMELFHYEIFGLTINSEIFLWFRR